MPEGNNPITVQQAIDSLLLNAAFEPLKRKAKNLLELSESSRALLNALEKFRDAAFGADDNALQDEHLNHVEATATRCYAAARSLELPTDPSPLLHALHGKTGKEIYESVHCAVDTLYAINGDAHAIVSEYV